MSSYPLCLPHVNAGVFTSVHKLNSEISLAQAAATNTIEINGHREAALIRVQKVLDTVINAINARASKDPNNATYKTEKIDAFDQEFFLNTFAKYEIPVENGLSTLETNFQPKTDHYNLLEATKVKIAIDNHYTEAESSLTTLSSQNAQLLTSVNNHQAMLSRLLSLQREFLKFIYSNKVS